MTNNGVWNIVITLVNAMDGNIGRPKQQEDLVEMTVAGGFQPQLWRGRLGPELAVFIEGRGREMVLALPAEVEIKPVGQARPGQSVIKVEFRLRERSGTASMRAEYFQRYQTWRDGGARQAAAAVEDPTRVR